MITYELTYEDQKTELDMSYDDSKLDEYMAICENAVMFGSAIYAAITRSGKVYAEYER